LSADDSAYQAAGRDFGPKRALFQTSLELGQVLGIDEALFKRLLPFVTVYSPHSGIDPRTAPPALLAALRDDRDFADVEELIVQPYPNAIDRNNARLPAGVVVVASDTGEFLLHVEVLMPNGALAVREAIVAFKPGAAARNQVIEEWWRGAARYANVLRAARTSGQRVPPC
ncbi:MAG: hypothetical protein ACRECZ_09345, partial [Methylocella sp.]